MKPHATLVEPGTVRLERLLPGPVDRVWDYIVDGEKRRKWLCAGSFEPRVGGKAHMEFDNNSLSADRNPPEKHKEGGKGSFTGEVTRIEPKRLLAHTWPWGDNITEVSYELTPQGDQVLLVIVHRLNAERATVLDVMGGWDVHTGILEDVLQGREPRFFWKEHARLVKDYEAVA